MRILNRAVFVVRYREPYLRWAASLDDKASAHAADLPTAMSVYLVPEDPTGQDETPPLHDFFETIFTQELESWWTDESQWPEKRDFATFQQWFEVTGHSMVMDLGIGPIRMEQL